MCISDVPLKSICSPIVGDELPHGDFYLHSRFERVVNLQNREGELVFVTSDPSLIAGNGIFLSNVDIRNIYSLRVLDGVVSVDCIDFFLETCRAYNSKLDFSFVDRTLFEANLLTIPEIYPALFHEKSMAFMLGPGVGFNAESQFDRYFYQSGLKAKLQLINGDIVGGVKSLSGTGFGLTPSGDDFIAGLMFALHYNAFASGQSLTQLINQVYCTAQRENRLTNSFFANARVGSYFSMLKFFLITLSGQNQEAIQASLTRLLSHGATSGTDLLSGYIFTVKHKLGL